MFAMSMQSFDAADRAANWFDAVVVLVLAFGIFRGRKNGMSKELLPTFQWIAMVFICGLFYSMVAQLLVKYVSLSQLTACLTAYAVLAVIVYSIFSTLRRTVGRKLSTSNAFGSGEYYLGMPSGMIRFACILIFALAFLNARDYTSAQIEAANAYQTRWYGSQLFPDLHTLQSQVFNKSFTGHYIQDYLGVLLIKSNVTGGNSQVAESQPAQ